MKLEAQKVKKFLEDVKYELDQLVITINSGDDGFEDSIKSQIEEQQKVINKFIQLNLTEAVVDPLDFTGRTYLTNFEEIQKRIESGKGNGQTDNIAYYKHKLYHWLKREYKKRIDNGLQHTDEETTHLLQIWVNEDKHWQRLENEFLYAFFAVYDDLSNDLNKIRQEQRKNSEQQKLFE